MTREPQKTWSASFPGSDRYTAPKTDLSVVVSVDGRPCEGTVLGRNGPRVQVRFLSDGSSFVRWFNAEDVSPS